MKSRFLLSLVCVSLAMAWAAPPVSAQGGVARAQLERFSADLQSLAAEFDQRVISTDGAVDDASSGKVWLQRPNRFRWEYGGDFPELVIADGSRVWIYDEMLEQVTVKDQSQAAMDSPLTLLTDPGRLDERFELRELGEDDGLALLELRSRTADTEFERILLGLSNDELQLMVMEDAFGLRTEIRFRNINRNPDLDDALFRFEPPEGVDVIGGVSVPSPSG